MQNEILKPVLDTDEVAVPRYDIVGPNGSVIQQNVELRLKNEVVQEGTPYDEESVLPASLREQLELPQPATPAEAFAAVMARSGGAVRKNRPPLTTDAESVGKLWVIPKMTFVNLMPGAVTQVASNWSTSTATVSVSGNTATAVGNASDSKTQIESTMLDNVSAGDKIFTQVSVKVNHDANLVVAELVLGSTVLATKSLSVPAAGATMTLQALATAEISGKPVLRVYATYNTAAVQSGKGFTVSAITVWDLTADMCEAQEGNEFTEAEAANYITTFGQFQTREYEYSAWWWVLRGVTDDSYLWHRMYDEATIAEAQEGAVGTSWMSPQRTQVFYTHRQATATEAENGTNDTKWLSPAKLKAWWDKFYGSLILPAAKGGTGKASWAANRLVCPSAATTMDQLAFPGSNGLVVAQNTSGAPYFRRDLFTVVGYTMANAADTSVLPTIEMTFTCTELKSGGSITTSSGNGPWQTGDYFKASMTYSGAKAAIIEITVPKFWSDHYSSDTKIPSSEFRLYINGTKYVIQSFSNTTSWDQFSVNLYTKLGILIRPNDTIYLEFYVVSGSSKRASYPSITPGSSTGTANARGVRLMDMSDVL